jgi:hypothetical protein
VLFTESRRRMKRLILVCCLWLLGTASAEAADLLNGDWVILTGKNELWSNDPNHPAVKQSADWIKDNWEVKFLVVLSQSARLVELVGGHWGSDAPESLWNKREKLAKANRDVKSIALMAQGAGSFSTTKASWLRTAFPPPSSVNFRGRRTT